MPTTSIERVTKTPGVCGGRACVRGHRIPVWGLVRFRQLGADDARILQAYPSINAEDLEAAWHFYSANRDEIENDIFENEEGEEGLVRE